MTNKEHKISLDIIIIAALLAFGSFLRFFLITKIPCGLYPDQALNGLDALRFSGGFLSPVFGWKEGLFIYLLALSHFLFGIGVWQIFIVSAFVGIATIGTTYLAVKEVFNKRIAFLSSFILASSGWHIALSRSGFRAILVPLTISLFSYLLAKSIKSETTKQKKINYISTALIFALGFYTYTAYVIFAFSVFLISLFIIFQNLKKAKLFILKNKKNLIFSLFTFSLVISPIVLFILISPDRYFVRVRQVSIFSQTATFIETVKIFFNNFFYTFRGLFHHGDYNWRHNPAGKPLLSIYLASFFFLTLFYTFYKKGKLLILIFVFLMMFLPAILTNEGTPPHSLRLIGIIPIVFILPAISLSWLIKPKQKILKTGGYILVAIILILTALNGYKSYFKEAPYSAHYYSDFRCDLTKAVSYLKNNHSVEIISDDFSFGTIHYLLYPQVINHLLPQDFINNFSEQDKAKGKKIILISYFGEFNEEVIELLSNNWQKEAIANSFGGVDFYVFRK